MHVSVHRRNEILWVGSYFSGNLVPGGMNIRGVQIKLTVTVITITQCNIHSIISLDQQNLTVTAVVCMTVQSPSLLVLKCGAGRFLLMKANVAASLVSPHSIRMRWLVRTVKRACPTFTTEPGFGLGSYRKAPELNTARSKIRPTDSLSMVSGCTLFYYLWWMVDRYRSWHTSFMCRRLRLSKAGGGAKGHVIRLG